jgi:type IV pilus assembly protein PilE
LVTVAIIAIVAALAWPAYTRYITRTKRAAGVACMAQVTSYMETYYTRNMRYDKDVDGAANTLPELTCMGAGNAGHDYDFSIGDLGVSTFTVTITPKDAQATQDTACGTLAVDQANTQTITGSGTAAKCFNGSD